jgi:hypothetical protein
MQMVGRVVIGLAVGAAIAIVPAGDMRAQGQAAGRTGAARAWTPPLTVDGQPDISGVYSNATYTPFERPADLGDKEFFTPEEAADIAKQRVERLADQPREVEGNDTRAIHYDDAIWMSERNPRGMTTLRTSIITEPKNGRLPAMTEEGRKRQQERQAAAKKRGGALDSAQNRSLSERCIIWQHEGPPILPTGYNSHLQIHQGVDQVVIMHEMMRDPRIVPLDGRPHVSQNLRFLRGDSRGRWEGNTLVIETTNFTDRTAFRGASADQRVIERFTPVDAETVMYQFTVDDPKTWVSPWSGEVPLLKTEDKLFEYACHEGNYGIRHILSAARTAEAEAAGQRAGAPR